MKFERPSKNLIVTLPTAASQTTTSATCSARWRPSTLPMKFRSVVRRSSVASWTRASPLPDSSPIDRSATLGSGHAQDPLGVEGAHPRVLGEVEAGRVGGGADVEEHERALVGRHLDRQRGPVDARQALEVEDRRRDAGARVARR